MPHPAQGLQGHLRQQSVATSWFTWSGMRLLQQEWPQNAPRPEKSWEPRHSATALTHTYLYTDEDSYEALARIEHRLDEQAITAQAIAYFHTDLNGAPRRADRRHRRDPMAAALQPLGQRGHGAMVAPAA